MRCREADIGENPKEADVSEVELRLSPDAESATMLELEHAAVTDPKMWAEHGPAPSGSAGTARCTTAFYVPDGEGRG
jgi:hypothetical protein